MANPSKRKGTRWESDIVRFLHGEGFPEARRVVQTGRADTGDIHVRDFVVQAKAYRSIVDGIRDGITGAAEQRVNAGLDYGVAIVKRPGKGVGDGYVVLTLAEFARLLRAHYDLPDTPS